MKLSELKEMCEELYEEYRLKNKHYDINNIPITKMTWENFLLLDPKKTKKALKKELKKLMENKK